MFRTLQRLHPRRALRHAALLMLAALPLATPAQTQAPVASTAEPAAARAIRLFLEQESSGLPGRVAIEFGALESQARPAPCARVEPFLPTGARLWGRSTLGLRCSDGTPWSAFLPVTVRVFAPSLVAGRALPAGHALTEADYRIEEIDLTLHPAGLLREARFVLDKVLSRPLAAGQALRSEHFRARTLVTPGDPVRLVYEGAGFSVSTDARALGSATSGEPVRVQTDSGRIVTGIARGPRLVEMRR